MCSGGGGGNKNLKKIIIIISLNIYIFLSHLARFFRSPIYLKKLITWIILFIATHKKVVCFCSSSKIVRLPWSKLISENGLRIWRLNCETKACAERWLVLFWSLHKSIWTFLSLVFNFHHSLVQHQLPLSSRGRHTLSRSENKWRRTAPATLLNLRVKTD